MLPISIPVPLPGGLSTDFPRFCKVRQHFDRSQIDDIDAHIAAAFKSYRDWDLKGKSVAIGVGSRGIKCQPEVVRAVVRELKAVGAEPFIVPAMGSHGGGTAEGQEKVLLDYGFGEALSGAPIRSSMETVVVGQLGSDTPIYCDKLASEADFIVPCNRIKPHTDFRGIHESGLIKMMAIGLAKHAGAEAIHDYGFARFHEIVPAAAKVFLENTKILFGIGIVENAYDQPRHIELIPREALFERDKALLEAAKSYLPKFLMPEIDVLFVDEIGKNISGAGMDPNVTGRPGSRLPGFDIPCQIHNIVIAALTEATDGNATGLGTADVTTQKLIQQTDWTKTYVNIVTSRVLSGGAIPLIGDNDKMALSLALYGRPRVNPSEAKIARIENTLELSEIWVSEPVLADIDGHPEIEVVSAPFSAQFDDQGNWLH